MRLIKSTDRNKLRTSADIPLNLIGSKEAGTSGRDDFVYMGSDGELISVKWKTMKVHFRYTGSTSWIAPYSPRSCC